MSTKTNNTNSLTELARSGIKIARLTVERARIVTAQKLTVLFSQVAMCAIAAMLGFMALVFISIALGNLLSEVMDPVWAYLIIAGFYVILLIIAIFLRKGLLINPIARFLSRLLLDAPETPESETPNADSHEQ